MVPALRTRGGTSKAANFEPILAQAGLTRINITGDGNCLFSALSDQLFGDVSHATEIRQNIIPYLRSHFDYFKQFVEVYRGGATRRNPKRKNGYYQEVPVDHEPSEEERNRAMEKHIGDMAEIGTWGGHSEICAFMAVYGCRVTVWHSEYPYHIDALAPHLGELPAEGPIIHIFYHNPGEHYSSVRNVDGPFEGKPEINYRPPYASDSSSQQSSSTDSSKVEQWRKDVVQKSLNFQASDTKVSQALLSTSGDVDGAVSKLQESTSPTSRSPTPGSSSVERDQDDDENDYIPNKRQDRRLSGAARARMQQNQLKRMNRFSSIAEQDRDSPVPSDTGSFRNSINRPQSRDSTTSSSSASSMPSVHEIAKRLAAKPTPGVKKTAAKQAAKPATKPAAQAKEPKPARAPVSVEYQGTARPTSRPSSSHSYQGTARPTSRPSSSGSNSSSSAVNVGKLGGSEPANQRAIALQRTAAAARERNKRKDLKKKERAKSEAQDKKLPIMGNVPASRVAAQVSH